MPLPLILIAITGGSTIFSIKKGIDAMNNNREAEELKEQAENIFNQAKRNQNCIKEETTNNLKRLGLLKIEIWDQKIGPFCRTLSINKKHRNRGSSKH